MRKELRHRAKSFLCIFFFFCVLCAPLAKVLEQVIKLLIYLCHTKKFFKGEEEESIFAREGKSFSKL